VPVICTTLGTVGAVLNPPWIWRSPTMRHLGVFDLEKTTEMNHDPLRECPELFFHRLLMLCLFEDVVCGSSINDLKQAKLDGLPEDH
jgi:hypothetical protein